MVRKRTSTHSMEMVIFPLTTENAAKNMQTRCFKVASGTTGDPEDQIQVPAAAQIWSDASYFPQC